MDKKLARIRMRKVRDQGQGGSKVDEGKLVSACAAQSDEMDVEPGASLVDGQGTSKKKPAEQSTVKK